MDFNKIVSEMIIQENTITLSSLEKEIMIFYGHIFKFYYQKDHQSSGWIASIWNAYKMLYNGSKKASIWNKLKDENLMILIDKSIIKIAVNDTRMDISVFIKDPIINIFPSYDSIIDFNNVSNFLIINSYNDKIKSDVLRLRDKICK